MEDPNAAMFFLLSPFFLHLLCVLISISIPHYRITVRSFFKFHFPFYIAMIFLLLFDTYRQTDRHPCIVLQNAAVSLWPVGVSVWHHCWRFRCAHVLNMHTVVTLSGAWGTPCRTCFFMITNAHI